MERFSRREFARRVAVVAQAVRMEFAFTVREVVLMGRSPHLGRFAAPSAHDRTVVEESLRLTDTWDIRDRLATRISGGELQRVMVARALAQEPELLLLDEPTSSLDINHKVDIFDLLRRLHRERGLTICVVSHDLNMAAEYSERLALFARGRLITVGDPDHTVTTERIREVYGAEVLISPHPITGRPYVITIPRTRA